jgi:glycosyltransferase involved in cell wall biosynthesis
MVVAQFWASSAFELSLAFLLSSFLLFILALVPALVRSRPVVHAIRKSDVSCKQLTREAVTVVVPSYNPGARVLETIRDIHGAFEEVGRKVLVVAVSDGSTDESVRLLDSLHEDWFVHISLPTNVGKGGALLAGFQVVSTSYVGFIDADGDIPPGLLPSMFGTAREENADVVFGSKWHPESDVVVSSMRRLVSKAHHVLQMMLFKLDISDTQAGIKVYKTNSLQDVLHTLKETGFSLDLEIFVSMSAHKLNNFIEMPVVITRSGESTISIRTAIGAFLDMLRIFWRSRIALRYDSLAYLTDQKTSEKTK